jgi:transcriptional regulator with XRE-family HTH domain/quercetin dioxygenase-like cupin family protein
MSIGIKLRTARHHQGLSLRELAAKAEVSASLLSQIETGKANPSVMSLYNIAGALELPVDYFLTNSSPNGSAGSALESHTPAIDIFPDRPPAAVRTNDTISQNGHGAASLQQSSGPVVRAGDRAKIELMGGVTWERLTPGPEEKVEFLEVCYAPGATSGAAMSHHTGREFGLILEGTLVLDLGFERYVLHPSDSVIFESTTPHRLTNPGPIALRAIWVTFKQN